MDRRSALSARYNSMIAQMGADPARYPLRFERADDGSAHVEPMPDGSWLWRVTERGRILEETRFGDDELLLYRLICDVAGAEGSRWQAQQPPSGKDPRRADFAKRLELVGKVSPAWRIRLAEELAQWLARHPYVDRPSGPEPGAKVSRGWLGVLVIAALVAGWAAAHIPLWLVWNKQAQLESKGIIVSAKVIERDQSNGKFADQYFVTYRYQTPGREVTERESVNWVTWRRVEPEGSTIDVLVDPDNPETSMVEGNDRAGRLMWIYAAIDALLALIMLRGWLSSRKAAATG